ncbi:hypothetical protein ACJX0J_022384, partial [Zea mays]
VGGRVLDEDEEEEEEALSGLVSLQGVLQLLKLEVAHHNIKALEDDHKILFLELVFLARQYILYPSLDEEDVREERAWLIRVMPNADLLKKSKLCGLRILKNLFAFEGTRLQQNGFSLDLYLHDFKFQYVRMTTMKNE